MAGTPEDKSENLTDDAPAPQAPKASYTDLPVAGQSVVHEGQTYTTVNEGLAYILTPPHEPTLTDPKLQLEGNGPSQSVFYNPIQQFNRDMTVLAMRIFGEDFVETKRIRSEKQRKQKQQKHERKKLHSLASQDMGGSSSKRRKVDNGTSGPVSGSANRDESVVQPAPKTLDTLDDDDLMDEDLIACESSALQSGTALPKDPPGQDSSVGKEVKDNNEFNSEDKVKETVPKATFTVLDALSATGLRALRYAHELEFVTSVTANDLSAKAVQSIELNIKHNRLEDKIKTATGNANAHMYQFVGQEGRGGPGPKYDVIDIDPYGTAVPFLDAAVQAVTDGGLLCVTCTDTSVFNSMGYLEKTFSLYGGLPVKGDHCHEVGLRLILHAITTAAAKYGIAIEPLLSLSIDYYARVFVRIRRSPAEVKFLGSKTALVYGCDHGCGAWHQQFMTRASKQEGKKNSSFYKHSSAQGPTTSPLCEHCGSKMHIAGPMYGGPIHNPAFIEQMLTVLPSLDPAVYKTLDRIEGMLETAHEEMQLFKQDDLFLKDSSTQQTKKYGYAQLSEAAVDRHPFYVVPSSLARVIRCQAPSVTQLKGALRHAGYHAVRSHAKPGSIKTDAPWSAIWHIMREWARQKAPIREGALKEGMAGFRIMQAQKSDEGVKSASTQPKPDSIQAAAETKKNGEVANGEKIGEPVESAESANSGIVFDESLGRDKGNKRLVRYQMNPRANWGPMARAK